MAATEFTSWLCGPLNIRGRVSLAVHNDDNDNTNCNRMSKKLPSIKNSYYRVLIKRVQFGVSCL